MARRVLHDTYFKQAKADGYVARSAYKLQQIQEAKRIMRPGDRVLDLGCAPGAWLQVAGESIGPRGKIVGLDLQPVLHVFPQVPPVVTLVGDIYKTPAQTLLNALAPVEGEKPPTSSFPRRPGSAPPTPKAPASQQSAGALFDVVLSDMAPNTTGHGDHERSIALCEQVVIMLPGVLRPGGNMALKVFEGGLYPEFLKSTARIFETLKGFKPKASRDVSVEMYVVGMGYKGGAPSGLSN